MPFLSPLFTLRLMLCLTDCLQGYLPKHAFLCSFVCIYSSMHKKKRRRAQYSRRVDAAVCVRALHICVRACTGIFSHSARLLIQQSRAFYMLALWLKAVFISSPDTWDWTRMYALVVMHRRTLYENVDSVKIKVRFYTTDINILRVASMHRIVIHCIDVSIHIDESLHP